MQPEAILNKLGVVAEAAKVFHHICPGSVRLGVTSSLKFCACVTPVVCSISVVAKGPSAIYTWFSAIGLRTSEFCLCMRGS